MSQLTSFVHRPSPRASVAAFVLAGSLFAAAEAAHGQVVYMRSTFQQPWGLNGNEVAMDAVFGAGNWDDLRYEIDAAASVFNAGNSFVFMEGSDYTADELEGYLDANLPAIQAWVGAGGRLLINAAPNEDDGMYLGFGATLNIDLSISATAANPLHPIFAGPQTPTTLLVNGNDASHATITGAGLSAILLDNTADVSLAERNFGSGRVVLGGLTLPWYQAYWFPQPGVANVHQNILAYASSPVPEPGSLAAAAVGAGLALARRRRR